MQAPVIVYRTRYCPYCVWAAKLLNGKGVQFEEVYIDSEPARRAELDARAPGTRTVPQIFVGDHHVGGFDDMSAMDRAGKLDALLFPES